MKYYEEEGRKETVFVLPVCRECEKTIEPGDNIYVRDDRDSIICYECGQLEV
jgi:RNase P subunit RPR2